MSFVKLSTALLLALMCVHLASVETLAFAQPEGSEPPKTDVPVKAAEGFGLSTHTNKVTYMPVEPVNLTVVVKNQRETEAWYATWNTYDLFKLRVTSPNGKNAVLTEYGKDLFGHPLLGSISRGMLQPGQEYSTSFVVNRLYDMTQSGEYKISVETAVPTAKDKLKWTKVVLPTISVKISP